MVDLSRKFFDVKKTYQAYTSNNIYKCDSNNLKQTLDMILQRHSTERMLIELPSTVGLTDEIINALTDNIDVRVIGGLTDEYSKSHKGEYSDALDFLREKATYSKQELKEIMKKFNEIESHINPQWNDYEKALYLYEYVKYNIVYRKNRDISTDGKSMDMVGNVNRTRTWDSLIGLINQLSTCSGFAHIYQELCTRQNISCVKVGGKYCAGREGDHAWNIITINGKNILVDAIWDAQEFEKGNDVTTGFGLLNSDKKYNPRSHHELHNNLSIINPEWLQTTVKKVSALIPKEQIAKDRVEHFLKVRELDRKRMMYLRGQQLQINNGNEKNIGETMSI